MPSALSVKVAADIDGFIADLKKADGEYKSFRDRLGQHSGGIAESLEKNKTQFRMWSREINSSGRAAAEVLGGLGGAGGQLAESFKGAGAAIELFSGASGLASIALGGGIAAAGVAAITAAISLFTLRAREAKEAADNYAKAVKDLTPGELRQNAAVLQGLIGNIGARRAAAASSVAGFAAQIAKNPDLGLAALSPADRKAYAEAQNAVRDYDAQLQKLQQDLQTTSDIQAELTRQQEKAAKLAAEQRAAFLASPAGQLQTFATSVDVITERLHGFAKGLAEPKNLQAQATTALADIERRIAALGDKSGDTAKQLEQLRDSLKEAIDTANTYAFSPAALAGLAQQAKLINLSLMAGPYGNLPSATALTGQGDQRTVGTNQVRIGGSIVAAPTVRVPLDTLISPINSVGDAVRAGFKDLPSALAGVLAPLLGSLLNSRAGAAGGAIGGAIGTGIGAFLGRSAGAGVGTLIGSAMLPIVGTAIGGLIGAGLGSLFGHHKKAVDDNTYALQQVTAATNHLAESMANVPTGVKVESYRYPAITPQPDPTIPKGPGVPQASVVININGTTDINALARKVADVVQSAVYRGGAHPLTTAMAGGIR